MALSIHSRTMRKMCTVRTRPVYEFAGLPKMSLSDNRVGSTDWHSVKSPYETVCVGHCKHAASKAAWPVNITIHDRILYCSSC